jgi:lauroyl/myristoyl acyltransferase
VVPVGRIPALVDRKVTRLWTNDDYRLAQERQMRYLLEHTERADEVPALAREFARFSLARTYLRWHPEVLSNQEIRGIEWLTTRRDPDRSVVLSLLHHNFYEGLFVSLKRAGAPIAVLVTPKVLGPETPSGLKQHVRVMRSENTLIPAAGGLDAIQARLQPGMTMAIASDVPGHTEVRFLGRRVLSSFGAPVIATRTNSQVVVATPRRAADGGSYIQVHEPLEPKEFGDPKELLVEMLRRHEEAVLAWPEVLEMPRARWGVVEE